MPEMKVGELGMSEARQPRTAVEWDGNQAEFRGQGQTLSRDR